VSLLTEGDRALVDWIAKARVGDMLPEEFQPNGTGSMIQRLVETGVVLTVYVGQSIEEAAVAAQRDCREWLEAHS
jgi:hypothetical protein